MRALPLSSITIMICAVKVDGQTNSRLKSHRRDSCLLSRLSDFNVPLMSGRKRPRCNGSAPPPWRVDVCRGKARKAPWCLRRSVNHARLRDAMLRLHERILNCREAALQRRAATIAARENALARLEEALERKAHNLDAQATILQTRAGELHTKETLVQEDVAQMANLLKDFDDRASDWGAFVADWQSAL